MKIAAADMLSDRMPPGYEELGIELQRILTDGGIGYRGSREYQEYALSSDPEAIEHTKTNARSNSTQQ